MDQLLPLASLAEAWGSRGGALGARVPEERLSALLPPASSVRTTYRSPTECSVEMSNPTQTLADAF